MTNTVTMREKVHAENLRRDWPEVAAKLKKLRSEKARLVAELTAARDWMVGCAMREKAASYRKVYDARLAAANLLLLELGE